MASSQYIPGNFKYGTNVNITGQFTNLSSAGAFNVPTVQNVATSAPVAVSHLNLTADTTLSHDQGILSIKNTHENDDIVATVNTVPFTITQGSLVFLAISINTVQKIV